MSTTLKNTQHHSLTVDAALAAFIDTELLPQVGLKSDAFWKGFDALVQDLAPKNAALLQERDRLQTELDAWHTRHPGPLADDPTAPNSMGAYQAFLAKVGYLVPEPKSAKASTKNVDAELAQLAGPQLVVPILNARYALNAANARWGSLYDALYGTDVIAEEGGCEKAGPGGYNVRRGAKVMEWARHMLDRCAPLKKGSHVGSTSYRVEAGQLRVGLAGGGSSTLANAKQLVGFQGSAKAPTSVLLAHNGLHLDVQINPAHPIGKTDAAGVCDVTVEAALSTILDLEDSVAAVDAADKLLAYRNWLGILNGSLTESFEKGGKTLTRGLNPDRSYTKPSGKGSVGLHGRSLLFVRNVGHLMTNPAITYTTGKGKKEIPEGILDAVITVACACVDLQKKKSHPLRNSRTGSVYIVKPKMHGPFEVAFADELFGRVEKLLGLKPTPSSSASWTKSVAPAPTSWPALLRPRPAWPSSTPAS